ncbi:hypothetical protein GSI_02283 [Ganoderma sinense ZZ0214-1]|uniref:Uncharacterized protein n=1 Tax=Ganoderma sinense ZZ0214-1 TaxID=1077348 RepID=A0A2G8SP68_9APHY|nr:hypothetical protein GSI_02283 [Ganoderma sinense ZZ0214-1]
MGHNRRRSRSSSSSSSSSDEEKKKKKDKHDKHGRGHSAFPTPGHDFPHAAGVAHASPGPSFASPPSFPQVAGGHMPQVAMPLFPVTDHGAEHGFPPSRDVESHTGAAPPPYTSAPGAPPASGFRIPLSDNMQFPSQQAGPPVVVDADGRTPVFIGSALFERAVHPCKIIPTFQPPARVAWGGREHEHRGRYDLLPFDPNTMEWVPASHGQLPPGRRPVEGGYEENGEKLYHALASVQGVRVPGKTGAHLVSLLA